MNQLISLRLTALSGAGKVTLKGRNGMVDCLVIPLDANHISKSANGDYYLNMIAWENDKLKDGKTHLIKQSLSKEVREKMSDDDIKNMPILGDVKNMEPKEKEIETYSVEQPAQVVAQENEDDLPFGF